MSRRPKPSLQSTARQIPGTLAVSACRGRAAVDPVRFVVLAHGRSGSSLLTECLRKHRELVVLGELMAEEDEERELLRRRLGGPLYRRGGDAGAYLAKALYGVSYPPAVRGVGFKIFLTHARDTAGARRAWRYLTSHRDIRLIRLSRWSLLHSWVSLEVATRTHQWTIASLSAEQPRRTPAFAIPPGVLHGYFDEMTILQGWADRAFANHETLRLTYERDLCAAFTDTLHRVNDFLGVERQCIHPVLKKLATRPLTEQVSNYDKLRRYFARTPYRVFFDEPDS